MPRTDPFTDLLVGDSLPMRLLYNLMETAARTPVTVLLLPDQKSDGMRFHLNGAASDVVLRRATQRPVVCDHATPNTPTSNFNVFATTWAEQYGFFDLKHADWPTITSRRLTFTSNAAEISTALT